MKAIEAFEKALFYVSGLYSLKMLDRPGAVIEKLSPAVRKALSDLKSDELSYVKYIIGDDAYYQKKDFEREKLSFDKKILK